MKQIEQCLDKAFLKKEPAPSQRWKAWIYYDKLVVYHYHHKCLVFDTKIYSVEFEWWEKQADRKGLASVLLYLEHKYKITLFKP